MRVVSPCEPLRMLTEDELAHLSNAIRRHRFVTAPYNRGVSTLAPYGTILRGDALYLQAVTVARDGVSVSRPKLGSFKVSGLSDLRPTPVRFSPGGLYSTVQRRATVDRRNSG